MRIYIIAAIIVAWGLAGLFFGIFFHPASNKNPNTAEVEIGGTLLYADIARDSVAQARGLSGRSSLAEDKGMLFIFTLPDTYGMWMKDMQFSIDIFWIRDNRVVDIEENILPPAPGAAAADLPVYAPDAPADIVLETKSGFAARHGIRIGDAVKISFSSEGGSVTPPSGSINNNGANFNDLGRYDIEALRKSPSRGGAFEVGSLIAETKEYRTHAVTYSSDGLLISGVMSVPAGTVPQGGYPVIILSHGYIDPKVYTSGQGTRREQKFFAEQGYVTIHPDYRGFASSSPDTAPHHDFYAGYTRDVINLLDALKSARLSFMDLGRMGIWGHSVGGAIAARVSLLAPEIRAYVLFASNSAEVEDNFYEFSDAEIAWLRNTYGPAGAAAYKKISPISYVSEVNAPVQLHHGTADTVVPIAFSEKMYEALSRSGKKAEFFKYPEETHEFVSAWPVAMARSLQFFDKYVKNAR